MDGWMDGRTDGQRHLFPSRHPLHPAPVGRATLGLPVPQFPHSQHGAGSPVLCPGHVTSSQAKAVRCHRAPEATDFRTSRPAKTPPETNQDREPRERPQPGTRAPRRGTEQPTTEPPPGLCRGPSTSVGYPQRGASSATPEPPPVISISLQGLGNARKQGGEAGRGAAAGQHGHAAAKTQRDRGPAEPGPAEPALARGHRSNSEELSW